VTFLNALDVNLVVLEMPGCGVTEINTGTKFGRALMNMFTSLGELEWDSVSLRTKASMAAAKAMGRAMNGEHVFGHRREVQTGPDGVEHTYHIRNEAEVQQIREFWIARADGQEWQAIAKDAWDKRLVDADGGAWGTPHITVGVIDPVTRRSLNVKELERYERDGLTSGYSDYRIRSAVAWLESQIEAGIEPAIKEGVTVFRKHKARKARNPDFPYSRLAAERSMAEK